MPHSYRLGHLPPEPHWEAGYPPSCDVCGTKSFGRTDCFSGNVYPPPDSLCVECRKAVADALAQRAYLASLG